MYSADYVEIVKEGNSFALEFHYVDDDGKPLSLNGYDIYSDLKDQAGEIIDSFMVQIVDEEAGHFLLLPKIPTLPFTTMYTDVLLKMGDQKVNSSIVKLETQRVVTGGE